MSEVKRFEMEKEYSLDINIVPTEYPDGSFVHYDDYAALQEQLAHRDAQIAALTAENVARGEIVERLIGQYGAAGYHAVQNSLNPGQSLLYDAMQVMKQPATDAAANALRAEGAASVGTLIRACAHEFPSHVDDIVEECAMIADNAAIKLSEGKC